MCYKIALYVEDDMPGILLLKNEHLCSTLIVSIYDRQISPLGLYVCELVSYLRQTLKLTIW